MVRLQATNQWGCAGTRFWRQFCDAPSGCLLTPDYTEFGGLDAAGVLSSANPVHHPGCSQRYMRKAHAATPGEWARAQLMVVGLSYRTTSLEKREQLAPISERSEQRGTAQKPMPGVLLATCNRIEL